MSSVVNTNILTVYYEDIAMVTSDIHAPLDGEFFGRPMRQNNQRFGAIGTGRPSISPTDFPHQGFEVVHKAEIDVEALQEKLNTTISSHMSSPPKVSTAPEDDVCSSDEAFDKNQPPALSSRDAFDSDSSSDIDPPSASCVNRQPLSALFDEWIATRQLLRESSLTNSPPFSARLAILEPKPRFAWHTTYEQLLISASEEALGNCSTTIKTDMPRGLARIRAKAPHHIDLWRANKPDEPPDTMMVAVKGGSERACFPCTPLMKNVPLPETTPGDGHSFDYQPPTVPITPRRQVLLDMLNYRPTRVYF